MNASANGAYPADDNVHAEANRVYANVNAGVPLVSSRYVRVHGAGRGVDGDVHGQLVHEYGREHVPRSVSRLLLRS